MIAVVPEAVDTSLFNPFEDETIEKSDILAQCVYKTTFAKKHCSLRGESERIVCSNPSDRFVFLSVFKWEHRKGWDTLLTAYWDAFAAADQVELQIRSYLPSSDRNGDKNITRSIGNYFSILFRLLNVIKYSPPIVNDNLLQHVLGKTKMSP